MKDLSLYTFVQQGYNASAEYRLLVPLITAQEMGLPIRPIVDTNLEGVRIEDRVRLFCESDVVMLYQPVHEATLHNIRMAKSITPSKVDGEWKYPPTFIVDTDDNLFNVNPHNMAFRNLGIRDHEGNDIPSGSVIGDMRSGEKHVLWMDGHQCSNECKWCGKGIDLQRNRHNIDMYRSLIEHADAVTCSTPYVEKCVQGDTKPRRTKVWPNLVRFDHYPQVDIAQGDQIKILWQGGGAHYEDWFPLREALGTITKKYPEVHWHIWGALYHWVTEYIPPHRYTYQTWCPYHEYKLRLVLQGHDISLAPLTANRFNNCRSAIKWYEASVLKKPAATLAQNTGPYQAEIQDGETGLLYNTPEEFVEKLSLLIEDAKERKRLAANAKDWVSENRDAFKCVPKWFNWLRELRAEVECDYPHMPDSQWDKFIAEMKIEEAEGEPVHA